MSIFPKRTTAGKPVTIHWNFNVSSLSVHHICPFIRIGVTDPLGYTTMLFEQHVLGFPKVKNDKSPGNSLNGSPPLLVLASYLQHQSGKQGLKEILERIETGIHYYFTYNTAVDAIPGKYTLLSEVYVEGTLKYSLTKDEDFFYVDKISIKKINDNKVCIQNQSPEILYAEIITMLEQSYHYQDIQLDGNASIELPVNNPCFLRYNEGKETIALHSNEQPLLNRNQEIITMPDKSGTNIIHTMHANTNEGYILENEYALLWKNTDGLKTGENIHSNALTEMQDNNLILPMYEFTFKNNFN